MLIAGTRLGRYEIVAPLGAGGMGVVYRARDARLDREVAIKVIAPALAHDPDAVRRFEQEARAVAGLSHPNILALHDVGQTDQVAFAVTELLDGESLRARLTRGPLAWRQAAAIVRAIAEGLAFAHARGIVHRDLKPENVFLTSDGRVKILDFGLARTSQTGPLPNHDSPTLGMTLAGAIVGTIGYAAPEQMRGEPIGPTADIFSLGCVLYEMVAGRRAFEEATGADTLAALLQSEAPPLGGSTRDVPQELERIVAHCLEKRTNDRFQSARDLSIALDALLSDSAVTTPLPRARAARSRGRSLGVLPFASDDDSPDGAYLNDGITEALINSLSSIPRLRVVPRSSVFRLKGRDLDPRAAGEALGVKFVLTGRIISRDGRLTIQAELIDVAHDSQIWGQHYTHDVTDLIAVQETIAREISEALKLKLTGTETRRLTKRSTENTDAYQDYLRGRYFFNKYTPDGFERAIECFGQAIAKDPSYALAHAGLGDTYGTAAFLGYMMPVEGVERAQAAAAKALALDPQLAEAHFAAAKGAFFFRRDWAAAERGFLRSLELHPPGAECRMFYALYLIVMGRREEARHQAERALDDDPLSGFVNTGMVMTNLFTGAAEAGLARGQRALQLDPSLVLVRQVLAFAYEVLGQFEAAIDLGGPLMAAAGSPQADALERLRAAYRGRGERGYWEQRLQGLRDMAARRYVPPFMFAYVYMRLNDFDRSFEYLERAYEVSSGMLVFLGVHPAFAPLHDDPRFAVLLKKIGVATERRSSTGSRP
jgi:serine/threonine protein kinase/tetratricopeptide (TPR) repeat protein